MMPDLCSLKFVLGIVWFPSLLHNETNSTTNYIDFIAYLAIGCWTSLLRGFLHFVLRGCLLEFSYRNYQLLTWPLWSQYGFSNTLACVCLTPALRVCKQTATLLVMNDYSIPFAVETNDIFRFHRIGKHAKWYKICILLHIAWSIQRIPGNAHPFFFIH